MTSEQLLATRATLWRQKGEPILTLEDAQAWLDTTGLCLFLPRKAQILAPAPSFVEAVLGETNPTPPRTTIETAKELLARLIDADTALPLNLLGTPADHPDFLVSKEALPFVYALRGDRDWKSAPGAKARISPLVTEVWKLLERRGVLTAAEIRNDLGRELTEAAVVRALYELWGTLRVVPLYQTGGQETLWEPLQSRHQKAIHTGSSMSQVTALSVLVSVYLQSVLAASSEDTEAFLSPLASRSKVREVIRGLTATRQLSMVSMETQALLHVEGSLPDFPEEPVVPALPRASRTAPPASERKPFVSRAKPAEDQPARKRPAAGGTDRKAPARSPRSEDSRGGAGFRPAAGARPGAGGRPFERKAGGGFGSPRRFTERAEATPGPSLPGTGLRADGTPKKPRWRDMPGGRPDQKGKPARFGPRKDKAGGPSERPERQPSAGSPRTGGARPPQRREGGSFRPATGAKSWVKRATAGAPDRPSDRPAGRSEGRPYAAGPRPAGRPSGPPRPYRPDRPGQARPGFDRPRPESARPGRPSFSGPRREGRPPSAPRDGGFAARPQGDRPYNRSRPAGAGRPSSEGRTQGDYSPRPPRPAGPGGTAAPRKSFSPRSGAGAGRSSSGSSFSRPSGRPPATGGRPSGGSGFSKRSGGGSSFKKGPGQGPKFSSKFGPKPGGRPGSKSSGSPSSRPPSRPPSRSKKRPE